MHSREYINKSTITNKTAIWNTILSSTEGAEITMFSLKSQLGNGKSTGQNQNYSLFYRIIHSSQQASAIIGAYNQNLWDYWCVLIKLPFLLLVIDNLNQSGLVVARSLKSMQIHHGCSYIGKSTSGNIIAEPDTSFQSRASNCNRHLHRKYAN